MNQQKYISSKLIVFSKWSRKEYAIFASLGKIIKIGVLKADICQKAMLKGLADIINIAQNTEKTEADESDVSIADQSILQLSFSFLGILFFSIFNLASITVSAKEELNKNYNTANTKSVFYQSKEQTFFMPEILILHK